MPERTTQYTSGRSPPPLRTTSVDLDAELQQTIRELIDAKAESVRAQNDARFAELQARMKNSVTGAEFRTWIVGAVLTIVAVLVAILAFGGDRFDSGMSVADVVRKINADHETRMSEIQADLRNLLQEVDALLEQEKSRDNSNE